MIANIRLEQREIDRYLDTGREPKSRKKEREREREGEGDKIP